jgi:hypothetical protein
VTETSTGNGHWVNGYSFEPTQQLFQLDFVSTHGVFVG